MDGFLWIMRAAMFACCLTVLFQAMPARPVAGNGNIEVATADSFETQHLQQKLMEAASRRYAGLAP
jgi:hypothetical protein